MDNEQDYRILKKRIKKLETENKIKDELIKQLDEKHMNNIRILARTIKYIYGYDDGNDKIMEGLNINENIIDI